MANLILHAGASKVGFGQVIESPTPDATESWHPIPHHVFVENVRESITRAGMTIQSEAHALTNTGARYFGLIHVRNGWAEKDYGTVLGLRNTHDRSYAAGLVLGSQVFVCDNLAFSGEARIDRRHTIGILRDLPQLTDALMGQVGGLRLVQSARLEAYKTVELTDAQVHDALIRALDTRIISAQRIPAVLEQWRTPNHPEFSESKTVWRLMNGFTEIQKGTRLERMPRLGMALHGLMDRLAGVDPISLAKAAGVPTLAGVQDAQVQGLAPEIVATMDAPPDPSLN